MSMLDSLTMDFSRENRLYKNSHLLCEIKSIRSALNLSRFLSRNPTTKCRWFERCTYCAQPVDETQFQSNIESLNAFTSYARIMLIRLRQCVFSHCPYNVTQQLSLMLHSISVWCVYAGLACTMLNSWSNYLARQQLLLV